MGEQEARQVNRRQALPRLRFGMVSDNVVTRADLDALNREWAMPGDEPTS